MTAAHRRIDPAVVANLVRNYGVAAGEVIAEAKGDAHLLAPLSDALPDCGAEILYAARREMAFTLADAVFRRTGIGTLGHPGEAVVARAAYLMAAERGWSAEEQARQVDAVMAEFKWPSPPP